MIIWKVNIHYVNVNERRFQFITEVTRQTKDELSQKEKGKKHTKVSFSKPTYLGLVESSIHVLNSE